MNTKSVMIYGAGQAGEMAASWLPGSCELRAFVDGNESKQGRLLCGVPVISPEEAFTDPVRHPDVIYLCVINREAADEIRKMITEFGFHGRIIDIPALREAADLRLAFLRLFARDIREREMFENVVIKRENIESEYSEPENGERGMSSAIAELGVYRGDFACEMNALFPEKELLLFDTFEGFAEQDLFIEKEKAADGRNAQAQKGDFSDTSIETVRSRLPHPEKALFYKGRFPDSVNSNPESCPEDSPQVYPYHNPEDSPQAHPHHNPADRSYSLVSLDTDLYEPTLEGLRFFYPRLSRGGVIIIHDYNSSQYPGVKRAVREFSKEAEIQVLPLMDLHGTALVSGEGIPVKQKLPGNGADG